MKLKKIAALALAGVMAVSMLAGCAGKGNTDNTDKTETTAGFTSDLIASVEQKVGKKDYVTYEADANLQKTLDAVVAAYGLSIDATKAEEAMKKLDTKLSTDTLAVPAKGNYKEASAQASVLNVVTEDGNKSETDYANIESLANNVVDTDNTDKLYGSYGLNNTLSEKDSKTQYPAGYESTALGENKVTSDLQFSYKVSFATAKIVNPLTGEAKYVTAYTVTRTSTTVARSN